MPFEAVTRRSLPRRSAIAHELRGSGKINGYAMTDDISEALRESEQRYRILFEQAPIGVFLYDRACIIQECNERFVEILHSRRAALVGLDMRRLRDQSVLPAIELALGGDRGVYEGPYAATTSGAKICISMRTSPLVRRAS